MLETVGSRFTLDVILRWHRLLVAQKWDASDGNLTDAEDGFLNGKRYVLLDRDAKFCEAFRHSLRSGEVQSVRLPPRSPNCNAHLERFMRGIKEESLGRIIFFGEGSLRRAVRQFLEH